jgi:hypothetical protein
MGLKSHNCLDHSVDIANSKALDFGIASLLKPSKYQITVNVWQDRVAARHGPKSHPGRMLAPLRSGRPRIS